MKRTLLVALLLVSSLAWIACSGANGLPAGPTSRDGGMSSGGGADGGVPPPDDGASSQANLVASATTQDFGTVSVGQQGQPVLVDITNTGIGGTGSLTATVAGAASSSFVVDKDGCTGQSLAPTAKCTMTMHFTPASAGALSASLTVGDAAGDAVTVQLTGTGITPPEITLLPAMQDFGTIVVSGTSMATTFTLANTGATDAGMVTMSLAGADAEQFTASMDGCTGMVLKANMRCSIQVAFSPTTSGTKMANLTAAIAGGSTFTSALTGNGAGAAGFQVTLTSGMAMPVTTYDFGQVTVGTTPAATQSFVVTNTGGVMSDVPAVAVAGANLKDFVIASNGCTAALPPNGTCSFSIAFSPSVATMESATVSVTGMTTASASVTLTGLGLAPAALQPTPASHNFGSVVQGMTSGAQTFTITNTGNAKSGPLTVSLSGSSKGEFTLSNDTCGAAQLAGGAKCTVTVTFAPDANASGTVHAQLLVAGTPGGTASASLTGDASTLASLSIGPDPYDYGNVAQGVQTAPVTFTVSNSGSLASGVPTVTKGGANTADFKIIADNCTGHAIPGNGQCTVSVAFLPASQAPESATITVAATPGGAVTAHLSGTGATQASLQIAPSPWPYGTIVQTMQSAAKTFTVTNTGGVDSGPLAVSMAGANPADFVIMTNNCKNVKLPANGAKVCTVLVYFKPSSVGSTETGVLTVVANPGGTATSALTGTGGPQGTLTTMPTAGVFKSQNKGTPSAPITFQVSNSGGTASGAPTVTVGAPGANPGDFTVTTNTCKAAIPANTMNACQIAVTFTPSTTSSESATLNIAATPGGTTVMLSGSGTAPSIGIGVPPASPAKTTKQSFATAPGTTQSVTFTITNTGTGPTGALSVTLPGGGPFSVPAGTDQCSNTTMLGAGSTCTFAVQYAPGAESIGMMDTATVTVSDTYSGDTAATAALTGIAAALGVNLVMTSSPSPATYSGSGAVTFTVTNQGATPTGKLNAPTFTATQSTTGDLDGDFAVAPVSGSTDCANAVLTAGQSCSYQLVFTAPVSNADGGGSPVTFGVTTGVDDSPGPDSVSANFMGSYSD